MNRLLILPVLLLTLLVGTPALSADYQKGLNAWESLDYATALRELKPLDEKGHVEAGYILWDIKSRLVSKGIDECLFDEIAKITGPETKKIVEKYCRRKMEKKSLDWLMRYAD